MSILILGDAMIDVHTRGSVNRISPEAPIQVVDVEPQSKHSLGAAANVAAQISEYGIPCFFAFKSFPSDDDGSHARLNKMCEERGIQNIHLSYFDKEHPVTTKERIWAEDQQLCRIDKECREKPSNKVAGFWIKKLKQVIDEKEIRTVVFSDYDKGTLTDYIIQSIADYCEDLNIDTILDPKRHSYWGLQNLSIIKPNNKEISITNMKAKEVSEELGPTYLLHTLGKFGMDLWRHGKQEHSVNTYAKPEEVVDVCGCGDIVTALLAIGLYKNMDIKTSIKIASLGAAENTKYKGCHILTKEEITNILRNI